MIAYLIDLLILLSVFVVLSVSYNLLMGYTGLFSLAHAVFYGIGAYVSVILAAKGLNSLLSIAIACIIAILVSLALAVPSLRVSGDYLVIASLGFQIVLTQVFKNLDITGGPGGISSIPSLNIFGVEITSSYAYLLIIGAFALFTIAVVYRIVKSPYGRVLQSIRDNESASLSLGKSVIKYKILSFALASMFASIAGGLYAPYAAYISPDYFTLNQSIMILAMVIIGGVGKVWGPVLGSVLVILLPEVLRFVDLPSSVSGPLQQIFYSVLVLVILLFIRKYDNGATSNPNRAKLATLLKKGRQGNPEERGVGEV